MKILVAAYSERVNGHKAAEVEVLYETKSRDLIIRDFRRHEGDAEYVARVSLPSILKIIEQHGFNPKEPDS